MKISAWRRLALILLVLSSTGTISSQTPSSEVARQIDAQVWTPMMAASNAFDADGFLGVLSPDLVRVAVDSNEVYGLGRYEREIRAGFARARERGIRRRSEVRFLSRAQSDDLARDAGIFRSEAIQADGEVRVRYTAFEVLLRREDGRWKILVDQDTARGGAITEEDYLKGTAPADGVSTP